MIDLDSIQKLPSVAKALKRLRSLSERPLEIKHMNDWVQTESTDPPVLHSAAYVRMDDRDVVYINDTLPEHMAVHELIHPILWAETYPDVALVKRPDARFTNEQQESHLSPVRLDGIRNCLEHLEVHRRMREDYGLDMVPYFQHKAHEHSAQLEGILAMVSRGTFFAIQIEIIDALEMFEYRTFFGKVLADYWEATPLAFQSCEFLYKKFGPVGFKNAETARQCYMMVKAYLVGIGKQSKAPEWETDLWKCLEFPLGASERAECQP